MSKYRKPMGKKRSRNTFTAGVMNINSKNTSARPMRGGIRL